MQELGAELKRIREEKGYQLNDVQQATKIRTRYLEAIEAGDLSAMPGVVYVRGFIKSYCDFLEVDGQEMLDRYGLSAEKSDAQVEPVRVAQKSRSLGKPASFNPRLLPQVAIAVAILVALSAAYALYVNRDDQQQVSNEKADVKTAEQQKPPANPQTPATTPTTPPKEEPPKQTTVVQQVQKAGTQTTYQVSGTNEMTVVLAASNDCWMQVTADGKVLESGIVKKGETRTWKAKQAISMQTGASKYLTVKVNEQPVQIEQILGGYTFLFNLKS
ncbi:cytoskeletal protein RodZ [Tumebacillus sp. BK434]|uniref:helix-turn-helix domain-containing protein n=1 Tax=Tumebacillus sp. BK434 TaxID=2512169 RepID=UPI001045AF5D|nr:RodZ domain-containing protein [Tumebacillus sp. BK434]TCP58907.1 cytoskeletal protein RodZ [Tumebacillus sp. BK434]